MFSWFTRYRKKRAIKRETRALVDHIYTNVLPDPIERNTRIDCYCAHGRLVKKDNRNLWYLNEDLLQKLHNLISDSLPENFHNRRVWVNLRYDTPRKIRVSVFLYNNLSVTTLVL